MTKQRKVVVVGGGVGGLVSGTIIAKQRPDCQVTVLEMHDKLGGLAQAWEQTPKLKRGGKVNVTYELTHAISEMHGLGNPYLDRKGGHYALLEELGVEMDEIGDFKPAPRFAQYLTPGVQPNNGLTLFNTLEQNYNYLLGRYGDDPKTREGLEGIFRYFEGLDAERRLPKGSFKRDVLEDRIAPFLEEMFSHPALRPAKIASLAALYGITKPTFVRNVFSTFEQILDKHLKGSKHHDELRTWFGMLYGYVGVPPSKIAGNLHALMLLSYWRGGGPLAPSNTSFQSMHDGVAKALITKYGGRVLLHTAATEIEAEQGKISGVRIAPSKSRHFKELSVEDGLLKICNYKPTCERIDADVVILAGDPQRMVLPLLGKHLPKAYVKKLAGYEMSMSLLATHVITDLPLHEKPYKDELMYAANILASSSQAIELENEGNFPEQYVIYVNVPTLLRPAAGLIRNLDGSPRSDLHLVDIVTRSPDYDLCRRLREEERKGGYAELKRSYADTMIGITDRMLIPDLGEHNLYDTTYTAATFDRYGNPTNGAVYSIAPTLAGFLPNRPSARIPLDGAFLTGSVILAGGVGGAISGAQITAREVAKYLDKKK